MLFPTLEDNFVVYGPLRVNAPTITSKNLRKNSAGIFQISTDPAMVYTRRWHVVLIKIRVVNN